MLDRMSDVRRRVLERRARFVAAAMTLGAASGVAACEPMVCLDVPPDCDADTRRLVVTAPTSVCEGDRFSLVAEDTGYCGTEIVTSRAVFATSDPALLVIEGATARALKPGAVTVTALFDGREGQASLVIGACTDAATDAGTDAATATDVLDDTTGDAAPGDAGDGGG